MIEQLALPGLTSSGVAKAFAAETRLAALDGQSGGAIAAQEVNPATRPFTFKPSDPFPPPDAFFRANKLAQANPSADTSPAARLAKAEEGRALNPRDLSETDRPEPLNFSTPQLSADSFVAVAEQAEGAEPSGVPFQQTGEAQQRPILPEFDLPNLPNLPAADFDLADTSVDLPPQSLPTPVQMSAAHQAYTQVQNLVGPEPDVSGVNFNT